MDPFKQLTREVRGAIGEGPGPERRRRQRRAVARLAASPKGHVPSTRGWMPLVAAAGALLLVWMLARGAPELRPPAAAVDDRALMAGAWLAAEAEPVTYDLAERSRVVLSPRSAARLVRADADQTRLSLERGELEIAATAASHVWNLDAGPFTLEAIGARCTVTWQPGTLTIEVHAGEVRVRGGSLPAAGQSITAPGRVELREDSPPPASRDLVEATHVGESTPPPREAPAWQRLARAGDHAGALAAAARAGLTKVLAHASAEDLDRLAHSARLAGAGETAHQALETLRRRFPRDVRARTAAFLLARVALEQQRDPSAAVGWFETYVQEQPSGPLVEEARARILEIQREQGDPARVQAAARAYLEHHPDGSRAGLARALLDPP